ncbi:ELYS protein, partial [Rissa tridactyla]|nr:ELYS protein [Rissa tridactyla]
RSRKTAVHQKLPVEENASFLFSPPLTKLTKKCKAGEADRSVQLKDLDPDLSSQFVFSPPLLRSRRKNVSSVSRIGKEPVMEIKFVSPFGTPADGTKSKQKETADMAEKTLRKNKKRLSNFPKPVVRRKML